MSVFKIKNTISLPFHRHRYDNSYPGVSETLLQVGQYVIVFGEHDK